MSLADSITLKNGYTATTYTGAADAVYSKIIPGKWILSTATPDEPEYLMVSSNVRGNGKQSDYLLKIQKAKNPPAGSPIGAPDAQLSAYAVIRVDYGSFTNVDVKNAVTRLASALQLVSMDQVLRGEL